MNSKPKRTTKERIEALPKAGDPDYAKKTIEWLEDWIAYSMSGEWQQDDQPKEKLLGPGWRVFPPKDTSLVDSVNNVAQQISELKDAISSRFEELPSDEEKIRRLDEMKKIYESMEKIREEVYMKELAERK